MKKKRDALYLPFLLMGVKAEGKLISKEIVFYLHFTKNERINRGMSAQNPSSLPS